MSNIVGILNVLVYIRSISSTIKSPCIHRFYAKLNAKLTLLLLLLRIKVIKLC